MEKENKEYHEIIPENPENSKKESMTDNNRVVEDDDIVNKDTSSEYETNESSSDEDETKENLDNEGEHGFESDDSVILEREEGDGQESVSLKKVDDDEDKKNPQYIPKRGTFYEHDDRTLEDSEDKQEIPEKNEKQNKKNVWMEKKERWSHDRYNDNEQAPKSRSELVAIYGYDIRNEDGPPKARRRRRYGRGPNKYTRTWEDEDAYKPTKPVKVVKPKNKKKEDFQAEEFETNDTKEEIVVKDENILEEDTTQQNSPSNVENKVPTNIAPKYKQEPSNRSNNFSTDHSNYRPQNQRIGTGRVIKSKPEMKKEIKDSDYRGFTKTRQFRNSKSEQKVLPKNYKMDNTQRQSNNNEDCTDDIQKELCQMNIQEEPLKSNKQTNQRQNSVPPRLQAEQKGSKRYSSLRQRSLPETVAPSFSQAANYYATEYNQAPQPAQQQGILQQPNSIHGSTPPLSQIPPPPLPTIPQQVPVTTNPILQAPPQFATPFPQAPPPFLPPTVPTASFIPQPAPSIINYVQGQAQFPQAPPYQGYQHQQFNAVNQAAELYQCQGGTTYYSTQNQHISQRSVPQKRPKAAIPIVPPPPQEPRGRGRSNHLRDNSMQGEEMCETVITNSNIYEDSILYVQQ